MISWPLTLPQRPYYPYSIDTESGLVSAEDLINPQRSRTYPDKEATFLFQQCTVAQFQAIREFYDITTNHRAAFSVPWLDTVKEGFYFCQFIEPPTVNIVGMNFDITIKLLLIASVPINTTGDIIYGEI